MKDYNPLAPENQPETCANPECANMPREDGYCYDCTWAIENGYLDEP